MPSEELFGPEAAGGYLAGPSTHGHWKIVLPGPRTDPTTGHGSWTFMSVRDNGEPPAAVPAIGPAG